MYIKPKLGNIPPGKLTASDIRQMCVWIKMDARINQANEESGLADNHVRGFRSLCCRALEKTAVETLLLRNPAAGCKLPQ